MGWSMRNTSAPDHQHIVSHFLLIYLYDYPVSTYIHIYIYIYASPNKTIYILKQLNIKHT